MTVVKFHAATVIESFMCSDGVTVIPGLMVGDTFMIPEANAQLLQEQGAGHIVKEPVKDVPEFKRASEIPTSNPFNLPKATELEQLDQQIATRDAPRFTEQVQAEANQIYSSGKFPEYLIETFQKIWCRDSHILKWVVIAFTNGFIRNADEGLHLYVSGPSGLGKSESVKAAMRVLPKPYCLAGQFSRKGFLYKAGSLSPGTVVLHDDHQFDEEEAGLYRAIIAGWRDRSTYYSVDKTASKEIQVPERITQIITSTDGLSSQGSEGQNESRFITIEISRSNENMQEIIDFIKNQSRPDIKINLDVVSCIWEKITEERRDIEIPYVGQIVVEQSALYRIREFKKFLCLIRSIALMRGRTTASEDDFKEAQELWTYIVVMIDNEIPGLTKTEAVVFDRIREFSKGGKRVELSALKGSLDMTQTNIYRALRGREGSFQRPCGGLCAKIRGLQIEQKYDRESGESDQIITISPTLTATGMEAPYSLAGGENDE